MRDVARQPQAILLLACSLLAAQLMLRAGFEPFGPALWAFLWHGDPLHKELVLGGLALLGGVLLVAGVLAAALSAVQREGAFVVGLLRIRASVAIVFCACMVGVVSTLLIGATTVRLFRVAQLEVRIVVFILCIVPSLLWVSATFTATLLALGRLAQKHQTFGSGLLLFGRSLWDFLGAPLRVSRVAGILSLCGLPLFVVVIATEALAFASFSLAVGLLQLVHCLALAAWLLLTSYGLRRILGD